MRQSLPEQKRIDTSKLPVGTVVHIESLEAGSRDTTLYEFLITHAGYRIVKVTSSHYRIDPNSYAELFGPITEGQPLKMRFQRSIHSTGHIIHACVKGPDWHYDVF